MGIDKGRPKVGARLTRPMDMPKALHKKTAGVQKEKKLPVAGGKASTSKSDDFSTLSKQRGVTPLNLPNRNSNSYDIDKPIAQQPPGFRARLIEAMRGPSQRQVPLVVAVSSTQMLVGRAELMRFHGNCAKNYAIDSRADRLGWQRGFQGFKILFYLEIDEVPLSLASLRDVEKAGISSSDLFGQLLLPEFASESSLILLSFLCKHGFFGSRGRLYEKRLYQRVASDKLLEAREDLLFTSLTSHLPDLTKYLLDLGTSPNAFDVDANFNALETADLFEATAHRNLLLEFGANPEPRSDHAFTRLNADQLAALKGEEST